MTSLIALFFGELTVAVRREAAAQRMGIVIMGSSAFFASTAIANELSVNAELAAVVAVPGQLTSAGKLAVVAVGTSVWPLERSAAWHKLSLRQCSPDQRLISAFSTTDGGCSSRASASMDRPTFAVVVSWFGSARRASPITGPATR